MRCLACLMAEHLLLSRLGGLIMRLMLEFSTNFCVCFDGASRIRCGLLSIVMTPCNRAPDASGCSF